MALTGNTLTTLNDLNPAALPDQTIETWHRAPHCFDFFLHKVQLAAAESRRLFPKIASAGAVMLSGEHTELDLMTDQAISTNGTTLTLGVVTAAYPVSDIAADKARGLEVVMLELMPAAMYRLDVDALTLQNSFATTLSTTIMTRAVWSAGYFDFLAAKPQGALKVCTMNLTAFESLVNDLATSAAVLTNQMAPWVADLGMLAQDAQAGSYMGVQIFASANVPQKDPNNWGTGFYSGSAYLAAPDANGNSGLIGSTAKMIYDLDPSGAFLRVTVDNRPEYAAKRVVGVMRYKVGLVNDANGNSNGFLLESDK